MVLNPRKKYRTTVINPTEVEYYSDLKQRSITNQSLLGADSRGTEQASLLQLELVQLLLAIHLDDQRHDENQEGGSGDPRSLSGALQELLGNDGSVGGGLLALEDDWRLRDCCRDPGKNSFASVAVSPLRTLKQNTKMYPMVKVREQDQDAPFTLQDDSNSLPVLKFFKSPSELDSHVSSAVKDNQNDYTTTVAKIPETSVPIFGMPLIPVSQGPKKNSRHTREVQEEIKSNARAPSVLRPRAVLSSPDNDELIGNKNKLTGASVLRKHSLDKHSPTRTKVMAGPVKVESPLYMRRVTKDAFDYQNGPKQRKSLEPAVSRQKTCLQKGKPSSM
ncbi:hypothetical protein F0562_021088 [Nyssa sinensis]|uniref:Uncharacterized protein n=1 Tax=Nyssa sinensis TaxID=561372 RepID=A0A5J5BNL6_9ASTE|nr:hypothetical protein F0562_021088 [Nyssa sinensis]